MCRAPGQDTWFGLSSENPPQSSTDDMPRRAKDLIQQYNAVAQVLSKQGKPSASRSLIEKAMALTRNAAYFTSKTDRLRVRTGVLNGAADHFQRLGDPEVALSYLRESLDIEEELGTQEDPVGTHMQVCTVLSQLGQHTEATGYAQSAIEMLSDKSSHSADTDERLSAAYQLLAHQQEELGNHQQAVKTLQTGARHAAELLGQDHPSTIKMKQSAKRAVKMLVHSTSHSRPTPGVRGNQNQPSAVTTAGTREQRQLAAEIQSRFPPNSPVRSQGRIRPMKNAVHSPLRNKLHGAVEQAQQLEQQQAAAEDTPAGKGADAFQATLLAEHPGSIQVSGAVSGAVC